MEGYIEARKRKKRKKIEKMLKNSFKKFIEGKGSMGKVSNYIYTTMHDHAGHFVDLLTEVSIVGSMY